ncbi:MAG TPA: SUF system NifU family Fe-S cluster assembly protein [Candidatus Onthocola stercoravium]|nr:SUF system NifU family Fe-S cluster assembly protein [Candidatus Onthocola stercoravium]
MEKREVIMDHYSNPRNRRRINDGKYVVENTRNSSCIDNLDIYVNIQNDKIEDITFEGEACAISVSSASIMTSNLKGKTVEEAILYIANMEAMLNDKDYNSSILKEAVVYEDTKNTSRKTCAWLPYEAVKKILENYR